MSILTKYFISASYDANLTAHTRALAAAQMSRRHHLLAIALYLCWVAASILGNAR